MGKAETPVLTKTVITDSRGNAFITFLKKGRKGDCVMLETSEKIRELQRKLYQKAKQEGESLWKKMIGKPYSGKLNVRFDEGELEIGHQPLRQFPTLPAPACLCVVEEGISCCSRCSCLPYTDSLRCLSGCPYTSRCYLCHSKFPKLKLTSGC